MSLDTPTSTAVAQDVPSLEAPPSPSARRRLRGGLSALTGGASSVPLILICALEVADEMNVSTFGVLAPEIRDHFGLDLTTVSILGTLTSLVGLLLAIPIGYLSDRVKRTWLISFGAAALAGFAVLTGGAPTLLLFALFRVGTGVNRMLAPAHISFLADSYPTDSRAGVYAARQGATHVGRFIGPIVAGAIATILFWQAVYVIVAIPAAVVAVFTFFKLREPGRGEQERRALGIETDDDAAAENPPSFGEALRISWNVRTLRRIIWSLPFLVGAGLGFAQLLSLYFDEIFRVGAGTRGGIAAAGEPFAIAGLIIGGIIANRALQDRPARVVAYAGLMSVATAGFIFLLALSPFMWVAVGVTLVISFLATILGPATQALLSVVIPARARGLGLSLGAVAVIPGYAFTILAAAVGDRYGLRAGIAVLVPVYILGSLIFTTAASSVGRDLRAAMAASIAAQASAEAIDAGHAKLLVIRDLDVAYGPVQILFNLDLDIEEGEIVALLGTNGAGKSTLLRAVCGLTAPANGAIFYDNEDITFLPAHEHRPRGIVMMPGGKGVFPSLTVAENLAVATWGLDTAEAAAGIEEVYGFFPRLRERSKNLAGDLSGGEQQMLALGQAFLAKPRLLLIDELSLGLAPAVVEQLLGIVRAFKARGVTVVLVEQSVNVALTIAERAVFLEKGEVRFSGPTEELMRRPDILRSVYLKGVSAGSTVNVNAPRFGEQSDTPALQAKNLTKRYGGVLAVDDVSFTVNEDQILGIIGPNGAGKTSLFDLLSGFVRPDAGELLLYDQDITDLNADSRAYLGLLRSFQDARLFPSLTVAESIAVSFERHVETRSATHAALHLPTTKKSEAKIQRRVDRLVELFGLGAAANKFVRELSTGQRRIVDLACVLAAEPKVVLLDEPSSGIAQKEAEELGPLLLRIQRETGCSMVVIEHDMPLLLSVADELLALELGHVVVRGDADTVLNHPQVIASYLGTNEEVIKRSGA